MRYLEILEAVAASSPVKFPTGIGKTNVTNPVHLDPAKFSNLKTWEGNPEDFAFNSVLMKTYQSLKEILKRNGLEFTYMGTGTIS